MLVEKERKKSLCLDFEIAKSLVTYSFVYRMIILVLILLVSISTKKRSFSAINIVKTRLYNMMDDNFLRNSLILYIKK